MMWNRVYRVDVQRFLNLRPIPSKDSKPLALLPRGQIVARLDLAEYNGRWWAVFADLGDRAVVGYVAGDLLSAVVPVTAEKSPQPPSNVGPAQPLAPAGPPPPGQAPPPVRPPPSVPVRSRREWEGEWLRQPVPGGWRGTVGASFTPSEFAEYLETLDWSAWAPENIALHHTWSPTLEMRPAGFTRQHINNMAEQYRIGAGYGWSAGPHLFVDDHRIWILTPLTSRGVHAANFNTDSIGVEMLGNYHTLEEERALQGQRKAIDRFDSGRGAEVRKNAVSAMASLMIARDLDPRRALRFHREEGHAINSGKKCPGGQVGKDAITDELIVEIAAQSQARSSNAGLLA